MQKKFHYVFMWRLEMKYHWDHNSFRLGPPTGKRAPGFGDPIDADAFDSPFGRVPGS